MRKQYVVSLTPSNAPKRGHPGPGQSAALTSRHARILLEVDALPGRRVRSDAGTWPSCAESVPARSPGCANASSGPGLPWPCRALPSRLPPQALLRPGSPPHRPGLHRPAARGRARWSVRLLAERVVELEACRPSAANWCAPRSKKPAQAVARPTVVIPPGGQRGLRRRHGGGAGRLCPARRSAAAAGLFRRSGQGSQGPHAPAPAGRAGPGGTGGQRVRAPRQPQSVSGLCPPPGLAPDRRHRATHRHRLRACPARLGRGQFPQAERIVLVLDNLNTHTPGRALPGLPAGRGVAHPGADRVALHPHPRLAG